MTQWSCLSYPNWDFIKLSQSLVISVPNWNVLLSFILKIRRFLSFALFPLWDLSKKIWKSPVLFYLFYPTFLFLDFYFWAGLVSLVVSWGKLLACHPKLTRRHGAVYSLGGLFTLSWLIFFPLYFYSQITDSLKPGGHLVPPRATKLTVGDFTYLKFARKLRVLGTVLKGGSRAVRFTLSVYSLKCESKHKHMNYLFYEAQFCLYRVALGFPKKAIKAGTYKSGSVSFLSFKTKDLIKSINIS